MNGWRQFLKDNENLSVEQRQAVTKEIKSQIKKANFLRQQALGSRENEDNGAR